MRTEKSLNSGWKYRPDFDQAYLDPGADTGAWESARLPHANRELPYNGFDESDFQFVSTYIRDIDMGGGGEGRRFFLDFGGVMAKCDAWLNGEPIGSHSGGFTPFSIEITRVARAGRANRLVLRVDSREDPDIPPFGFVIDYLCYGGVYREVSLRSQAAAYIKDLWCRPANALEEAKELCVEFAVDSAQDVERASIRCRLEKIGANGEEDGCMAEECLSLGDIPPSGTKPPFRSLRFGALRGIELWDIDSPILYRLSAILESGGRELDRTSRDIGFREAEWRREGFFLNGRRLALRGLNRHQAFPYSGYSMPARAQAKDADILKFDLGLNIVRTSHYPQSVHFLNRCDRIGLLALEELPGWQHIGGDAWKDSACDALEEMILRDRSRPSVVLWGVRVNESADDHGFYARTNDIAHRLDPDRATGGIRCMAHSEVLEDVYTFNDFVHEGGKAVLQKPFAVAGKRMPYLVTEHNGHMFPAKRFDAEERLREHALRHARVLSAAASLPGVAGAIGWCAFDYNTHKDFGSGDRICYHGVADMFRIPKYAAWAYMSQIDHGRGIVLEAASLFAKGERNACCLLPIEVYTNCDYVVLYRGGERVGAYRPAQKEFPGLAHPPVIIRDLIGERLDGEGFGRRDRETVKRLIGKIVSSGLASLRWRDYLALGWLLFRYRMKRSDIEKLVLRFGVGWGLKDDSYELSGWVGGQERIRRRYGPDARPERLAAEADDAVLSSGDWDCTRIVLRLLDQYGNICPFVAEAVEIEVAGPASVIGPSLLPLIGGCIGFWLKTSGGKGKILVKAKGSRFASNEVEIEVR